KTAIAKASTTRLATPSRLRNRKSGLRPSTSRAGNAIAKPHNPDSSASSASSWRDRLWVVGWVPASFTRYSPSDRRQGITRGRLVRGLQHHHRVTPKLDAVDRLGGAAEEFGQVSEHDRLVRHRPDDHAA